MKYLVMECGTAYAVVLDENGLFLRVANMGYEVGQTVTSVVPAKKFHGIYSCRRLIRLAASVIFLCLMMFGGYHFILSSYGTVRMQINPDILISVNRLGFVLNISGLNEDGRLLAAGYGTFGKKLTDVSCDMAKRAVALGYLTDGGTIGIASACSDDGWMTDTETRLMIELQVCLAEDDIRVSVTRGEDYSVEGTDRTGTDIEEVRGSNEVVAVAVGHFGLTERMDEIIVEKIKEKDQVFEIEFILDGVEYDCEIRKADGVVIKSEIDVDDD